MTTPTQAKKYEFHPLSLMFPLIEGDELDRLVADIRTNGLQEPIRLYQDEILDGRNRYLACQRAGIEPQFVDFKGTREQARALVISANIHRRHLSLDQRRTLLAELVKADPSKSNRQIAEQAKVSHHTVGAVRAELEATGQVAQLENTTGADGKKRKTKAGKTKGEKGKAKQSDAQAAAKTYHALQEKLVDALCELKDRSSVAHAEEYGEKTKTRLDETLASMREEEKEVV